MKNLNKVLAMLVVFMMVLSTVAFASSFTDVADTSSYSTAIEVGVDLSLIKGYEDGTFKPEGEITRAEFAAIIVRLLGQEAQAAGAKAATQFIDVPADHWAAGYVNIATEAKVINGYGDGNFGPEDLVEYQDAITMMVRALGYEPAIGSAGYPTGYLTKAGELGLTSKVNGTNGVAANRATVAQIAFNALDVPIMTQSGYGTFTQYVINDGYSSTMGTTNVKKTLLSENHSTVKLQGTVLKSSDSVSTSTTAAPYVQVNVTDALRNKFGITTGEKKMYVGESDAAYYVGKKVVLFAEYDEFEDTLTVKSLYEVASDVLAIDITDIVELKEDSVKYYVTDSKTTTATISTAEDSSKNPLTKWFYNGVEVEYKNLPAKLLDMSGTVELSLLNSETSDADYDTVYITAYDVFVVDSVSATSMTVRSKIKPLVTPSRISFNEEEGDVKATLMDAEGNVLDWTTLEEYDVLSVKYVNTGVKDVIEAYVIENVVEGTVTGISGTKGGDDRYVEIDGTEYKVAGNGEAEEEIKLGDEGTYYLDDNNNVVYHSATITRNTNYAYVISAYVDATGMDNAKVKVLTKDAGVVTVEVANKITVSYKGEKANNISVKNFKADIAAKATDSNGKDTVFADLKAMDIDDLNGTVVTYKLNANGQVSAIEIPAAGVKDDEFFTKPNADAKLASYDEDRNSFVLNEGSKHYLTENTVVFYVYGADEEDYEVVALNNLSDGDTLDKVDVYDIDEDRVMGAIVIKSQESFSPSVENATFVTKTATTTDEDGYDVVRVTGYVGLEEVSYICEDGKEPAIGSLVVPSYAANGDVDTFLPVTDKAVVDKEEDIAGYAGTLMVYTDDGITYSPIDSSKGYIYLDGKAANEYKVAANANVYVYDENKTGRVKYVVDAGLDYVECEVDEDGKNEAWYIDGEKSTATVTAYLYIYDGDVVDVLYYISAGK